jgi:hypothetical protein
LSFVTVPVPVVSMTEASKVERSILWD